ncbi:MAG TPA: PBSX family phage terminase large subunit [Allosphingosinicella sp.]|nr:PBSX family phage terminase large subunit [Allosphingosinicella sp.]
MDEVEIPGAFRGLFEAHRYKAFYGGRGSAKSHSFATALVILAAARPLRIVCAREIQNSLRDSVKQLIEDKISALGLDAHFDCQSKVTKGRNGSHFSYIGLWRNPDAIKSMEGADIFWGEEASAFSERSLRIVRPTMRKPGSELWFSWNPEFEHDPVDRFFRGAAPPPDALVREVSWRDNPWFAGTPLQAEMDYDYAADPARAAHVWGGSYVSAVDGAYYAAALAEARAAGRIGQVAPDPLMAKRAFWDLGVSDATSIWVAQFVGREIRVLDHIEGQGQPLSYYCDWLRSRGHGSALCVLPHDGARRDNVTALRFEDHLREAGFAVETIPNQGKGAAMRRIEAARRLFPAIWFHEETCRDGLKALAAYAEKRDDKRNIGLGPDHNWASHAADAFGLMCIAYEAPRERRKAVERAEAGAGGWMG